MSSRFNRIEFDIQGTKYSLPINPSEFDPLSGTEYGLLDTVDGEPTIEIPYFDSRRRQMSWESLPNREPYKTMVTTLRSAAGLDNVRMRLKDLDLSTTGGDIWKDITIQNLEYRYTSANNSNHSRDLTYNVDMTFSYKKNNMNSTENALFLYQPSDYATTAWLTMISGVMDFHTIICNPQLGPIDFGVLRGTYPSANLLMYYNVQDHHMHTFTGNYFNALNAATIGVSGNLFTFTSAPFVGDIIHNLGGSATTQHEGTMGKDMADPILYVVSGNCMGLYDGSEYDGVYIDMLTPIYPNWKQKFLDNFITLSGHGIDFDGDGSPETVAQMQDLYVGGRNYFVSGLRLALPDKIIMGNTTGDSSHPGLNGFTAENIAYTKNAGVWDNLFRSQSAIADDTADYHIAWAIHPLASGGNLLQFCNARQNVLYGYSREYWL